jgi:predicted glycosyltransferase
MNILFYFGHPSQYLFLRNTIKILREKNISCEILIKSKDVLENLLIENKESYINILPEGRRSGNIGTLLGLIKRDIRLFRFTRNIHYDLFIGTDPSLSHIGFLKKIPVITVLEDDINVIPKLARLTFPFTTIILTPKECNTGQYEYKTIHYDGYMKLAYLHPRWFTKKAAILKQPYFLIRISNLDAYHDSGINGFNLQFLQNVILQLLEKGSVFISSEGILDESLKPYELKIKPSEMQDVLGNAKMLISDSQSMTMEAAMLGIPTIRFSDFAGKISVLEELEKVYGLTYGFLTNAPEKLIIKLKTLLSCAELEREFQNRRQKMLNDKIDVTSFLVWLIENFPGSVKTIKENPEYQNRFKSRFDKQLNKFN